MENKVPVKMGGEYELQIESLTHDGLGIGRVSGFLVFVHDALPGEFVVAKVTQTKKKYAHAIVVKHIHKSENRVEPPCPIFEKCGGCQIQHMDYKAQLEFKTALVSSNLKKIAKLENPPVLDTIGMENPLRYRNKTQIPFSRQDGKVVAGFYEGRSHHIVDMDSCLAQTEEADAIINMMKQLCEELGIFPYDERSHAGILRHVVVRTGFNTGEIMIILVTKTCDLPNQMALVKRLKAEFPKIVSVAHNINPRKTNVIFGDETCIIYGKPYFKDTLDGIKFLISPRSFYQVNPIQTEVLYNKVVEFAAIAPTDVVFDAYCGIGTITLFLARHAGHVFGVEIIPEAIQDANKNAELNAITNVTFECGKSEEILVKKLKSGEKPDVVVVDPPRKGLAPEFVDAIIKARPPKLIYVSCDSSTLARDVKLLVEGGYELEIVQPVDMFCHSSHVECVALMSRK